MKNKTKNQMLYVIIILLVGYISYKMYNPSVVRVDIPVPYPVEVYDKDINTKTPEFRNPPIKEYKPGYVQQMGILLGDNDQTLPLYGKEVTGRRDRYHFYTTTDGENLYPLPVSHENRDCMDDIGCKELYGNENVSVMGKMGTYNVQMYRTDNFF
jgi:hypothetical protein